MTQRFRILSDLHLERCMMDIPHKDGEEDTILLLAGDVCNFGKRTTFGGFIQNVCERFKHVVYVPGNHEYYDSSLTNGIKKFWKLLALDCKMEQLPFPKNLTILDSDVIEFGDVVVIGATCWTSFRNANPIIMNQATFLMNDYAYIRHGGVDGYGHRLTPDLVFSMYYEQSNFIFEQIQLAKDAGKKVIVVTHHAPSHESVPAIYKCEGDANELYANHFEYRIESARPDFWVHGHIHTACEYKIADTTVICNPRGYIGIESGHGFDVFKEIMV